MTITRKYALLLLIGILLVQSVSAMISVQRELALVQEEVGRHEQVVGRVMSRWVATAWAKGGEQAALDVLDEVGTSEPSVTIRWVWPAVSTESLRAPRVSRDKLSKLATGESVVVPSNAEPSRLYTYIPVKAPDGRQGAVEVSESMAREYDYMQRTVTRVSATALVLALLTTGIAWSLGARLIGVPMGGLVRQARRVGGGDFSGRLQLQRGDEIGQLAHEMDRMCDGLETAWARVRTETQARLQTLEQLRHADRLRTLGTLASGVAHELGTPINVIDGHAQLIREDPETGEAPKEHATVISRQCKRMTAVIRQLLDFARRGRTVEGPCELRSVVRDTLRMIEPMAHARNVKIRMEPGENGVWAQLGAEPMQQVITNIILNGLDATEPGGTLDIRVSEGDATKQEVRVVVEDTGAGMDEATLKQIFEPFFTTKGVGKGTGLGLSVAHGIVEDHGGRIEVESEPGRGSKFSVVVPARPA